LRTLAAIGDEQVAALPAQLREAVNRKKSMDWPKLAEPRELVMQLVEDCGLHLSGAEQIPHDVWPAGGLPALSLAEQLTVLLIGFDLTFIVDSRQHEITLVPITAPVTITRRYRLPDNADANLLKRQLSDIEMRNAGNDIVVNGTAEDHERLADFLRPQRAALPTPPAASRTKRLYTLRIEEQPLREVLVQLGQQLGWTIEIDDGAIRAAGNSLDERVTVSVQNVDEDDLFRALLRPAGLAHQRDGNHVRIIPLGQSGK
jgi:hypothetical protein